MTQTRYYLACSRRLNLHLVEQSFEQRSGQNTSQRVRNLNTTGFSSFHGNMEDVMKYVHIVKNDLNFEILIEQ